MAAYAWAEIIAFNGNRGPVNGPEEAAAALTKVWEETRHWAAAVAAGDADEPMEVVMSVTPDGNIIRGPALPRVSTDTPFPDDEG